MEVVIKIREECVIMSKQLKKSDNIININNPINNLLIDSETREKRMRMNNFLRLMEELVLVNQEMLETDQKKAS